MKLKPLSICYLRRPKHYFKVKVLSDHFPYPAVTISHFENDWIVKRSQLITAEEYEKTVRAKQIEAAKGELASFLEAWKLIPEQPRRFAKIGCKIGVPACAAYAMFRRSSRLGLI